jgi:hypothetical protein
VARLARFKVYGARLDGAASATVEINRETGIVEVRPNRRHYTATVTLAWLAEAALWQRAKALAAERRSRKRKATRK